MLITESSHFFLSEAIGDADKYIINSFYARAGVRINPYDYPLPQLTAFSPHLLFIDTRDRKVLNTRFAKYCEPGYDWKLNAIPDSSEIRPPGPYWLAFNVEETVNFRYPVLDSQAFLDLPEYLIYAVVMSLIHDRNINQQKIDQYSSTAFPRSLKDPDLWNPELIAYGNACQGHYKFATCPSSQSSGSLKMRPISLAPF